MKHDQGGGEGGRHKKGGVLAVVTAALHHFRCKAARRQQTTPTPLSLSRTHTYLFVHCPLFALPADVPKHLLVHFPRDMDVCHGRQDVLHHSPALDRIGSDRITSD